jgi:hypothetical protein
MIHDSCDTKYMYSGLSSKHGNPNTRESNSHIFCGIGTDPVLGDRNTGILILCTILVYKFVPVL